MATLSLEARRRFSRPSFLADCRHSTARYHRSGNAYQNNTLSLSRLCFVTFNRLIPKAHSVWYVKDPLVLLSL